MIRFLQLSLAGGLLAGASSGSLGQGVTPLTLSREPVPGAAAAKNLGVSGFSSNVEGTGRQGVDNNTFFVYQAPSSVTDATKQTLRVQRSASYPNSYPSVQGTAQTIWGLESTSPVGSLYEWTITGELHNETGAMLGSGAQNIAVNGTAFKQFQSGYNYAGDQIGPTWGGNFVCNDLTGTVNPTSSCIGTEIDNYFQPGSGADVHANRVVLQLAWGTGGASPLATDHIGTGILMGGNGLAVMDNAIKFTGGGAYDIGLNFSGATFQTAPIFLGQGQKIVFDGGTSGTYNWVISDIFGTMALQYGGSNRLTVDSSGNVNATNNLSSSANIMANGTVKTGGFTVVTLNAIAAPLAGMRAYVTDATSCALNGALTGGGSIKCPVWYDGSAWVGD